MDTASHGTPADMADRRATALAMFAANASIAQVARAVGVDRKTARKWKGVDGHVHMGTPNAKIVEAVEAVSASRAEAMTAMARAATKAAESLEEVADLLIEQMRDTGLDPRERRAAALELADRAGWTKQSHLEVNHTGGVTFDVTELRAKIRRAREASERARLTAQGNQGAK